MRTRFGGLVVVASIVGVGVLMGCSSAESHDCGEGPGMGSAEQVVDALVESAQGGDVVRTCDLFESATTPDEVRGLLGDLRTQIERHGGFGRLTATLREEEQLGSNEFMLLSTDSRPDLARVSVSSTNDPGLFAGNHQRLYYLDGVDYLSRMGAG